MDAINKKQLVKVVVLAIVLVLFFLIIGRKPRPDGPMKFIFIPPSEIYQDKQDSLPTRYDAFAILNLNRSDSIALLNTIANHACQVIDTIDIQNYSLYRIEYFENGIYMNDSTQHRRDRPLWHIAEEINAFVYGVDFNRGSLEIIVWYKTGNANTTKRIPINDDIKRLFSKCHPVY